MLNLKNIKKIHFVGIKGIGMTALACILDDMGKEISGSDLDENFVTDRIIRQRAWHFTKTFRAKNIKDQDLLVYSGSHNGKYNIEVKQAL